jgi:hypothetical protein
MKIPSGDITKGFYFVAVDATDLKTRETGLTGFTVYRSRNNAAAAAMTTPTITEVSAGNMPGVYFLLCDEDMTIGSGNDNEAMTFHITCSGMAPVTREIELYRPKITLGRTFNLAGLYAYEGTATAGTSSTITLDASAPAVTSELKGQTITIISGTGVGQSRLIATYTSGRVATVSPAWTTTPDNTSVYVVGISNQVDVRQLSGGSTALTNLIAAYDGTGYAGGTIKQDVNVVSAAGTAWASGAITSGVFASGAITAGAFATDSITNNAIAGSAVTEIQNGLATAAALAAAVLTINAIDGKTTNLPSDPASASTIASSFSTVNSNLSTVNSNVLSVGADLSGLITTVGAAGAGLSAITWNSAWDAEVQSEVTDALNAYDPPTKAEMDARTLDSADYATSTAVSGLPDAATIADAVHDEVVDGTFTFRESTRLQNSAAAGKASGAGTTNYVLRDLADTKDRIDATVDALGNRTAITRDAT